ncbi:trace amine-associated receptor 13c-like [Erpetoichthys calabaricus]|uniref:trace amine-associated receptor 13c-like n=1 Tax=Erpetoichthys calabaricus TaxID=27687 RepID=UPI0010A007DE|nr:trace amine-associated receptor 13c-like [Erpetoichthys calabaricus]
MMDANNLKSDQQYCYLLENTSCLRRTRSRETYVILYICSSISLILTIFGNLLVVISVSHFRQLHTPSNFLVLSLAAADFLIGIFLMPPKIIQIIEDCWYFGDNFCYFHALLGFLLTTVSVSNLVFIAIDRYVAVCDPLLYGTKITIPLIQIGISSSWILSVLYAWAILFFKGHYLTRDDGFVCLGECVGFYTKVWGIVDLIVTFIFPCTVIICLYSKVFMVVRRHLKKINTVNQQIKTKEADQNKIPKKSERKAAKTLGIVIFVFLLFCVPFYLCAIMNAYTDVVVPDAIFNIFLWLAYFNSGMNPIIYALFYPWFQKSIKLIVTLKICSPESSIMNVCSVDH